MSITLESLNKEIEKIKERNKEVWKKWMYKKSS
jgi:hypothetical protein